MTEEKERSTPKSRIESLSDLIFGLALSIGALTLIGQSPSDFDQLLLAIMYYAFSFFILIRLWNSYTQTMSYLRIETSRSLNLNMLLLFLVSIEPFLFNQLLHSNLILVQNVSIIYALDLGGLFIIQAFLTQSVLANKNRSESLMRHYKLLRNAELLGAIIFFISALPVFWIWMLPINDGGIPLRFILWIIPLLLPLIRRLVEKEDESKGKGFFRGLNDWRARRELNPRLNPRVWNQK